MIKKLLIQKSKKAYIEEQDRDVVINAERIYFVEDTGKDFHCSEGVIRKEDLSKDKAVTNKGREFHVIDASFIDSYKGIRKSAQTIPLKDLGMILSETGIGRSSVIIDAGAGSGGCCIFLARHVKKVYTFDISDVNIAQTRKNLEYFNVKNVVLKKADIYENIPVKKADLAVLDVPEPWRAVKNAFNALKRGGFIVAYCPQITQTQEFVNTALSLDMIHVKTVEIVEREWRVDGKVVRPKSLSNIHSGFLTFMRRL